MRLSHQLEQHRTPSPSKTSVFTIRVHSLGTTRYQAPAIIVVGSLRGQSGSIAVLSPRLVGIDTW